MWMLVCLTLSQSSLRLSSFLFILFYSFPWQWLRPFCLPGHLSIICLSYSTIDSFQCMFLCNYCIFFYLCLFFSSSVSSCIFLICASILFLISCFIFIFTVIIVNSFSGSRLAISTSLNYSSGVSCFLLWHMTLLSFCLTFCDWFPFRRLQDCSSCFFCCSLVYEAVLSDLCRLSDERGWFLPCCTLSCVLSLSWAGPCSGRLKSAHGWGVFLSCWLFGFEVTHHWSL